MNKNNEESDIFQLGYERDESFNFEKEIDRMILSLLVIGLVTMIMIYVCKVYL